MATTVRVSPAEVTYRPGLTVERAMVALGMASTEGAAHQLLLKQRETNQRIAEACHMARAGHRLAWFAEPLDRALETSEVVDLDEASLVEQDGDGDEDSLWEAYRVHPSPEAWERYKRAARRYMARLETKLRAGNAKHGGDA